MKSCGKWSCILGVNVFLLFVLQPLAKGQDIENITKQKPVKITGGLSFSNSFYLVNGTENRRSPYSYSISGAPTLSLYGITFPFTISYSDEQSSFSQPFNRFGVSPYYKWVKVHLGHRNVRFSPYTLAGHTFFGIGVELNPGIFRFGAVYGKFQKAIPEDTTLMVDTVLYQHPIPAYKRKGYSFKIGIGNEKNYFDIIYFKARDDTNSIPYKPEKFQVEPGENAVFGISQKLTIAKSLTWKTDIGFSIYTLDQTAQPLDEGEFTGIKTAKIFLTPNVSTQLLTAGETSLLFKQRTYSLQLKYRRIDPDYKSMGAYYFQTDLKQFTIAPMFMLFKSKFVFNGSLGIQTDNLYDKKAAKTGRTIGSFNIVMNPGQKFGLNIQYSNYGISQTSSGLIENQSDSLFIKQISKNIAVSPRLSFITQDYTHIFNLYLGHQQLKNKNRLNDMTSDMSSIIANLSYNYLNISTNFTLSPTLMYNLTKIEMGNMKYIGFSVGIGKPLFNNKLQNSLSLAYNKNYFDNESNGHTINLNSTFQIQLFNSPKHNLLMTFYWMNNKAINEVTTELAQTHSFSEFQGTIGYNFTF